ncbi:MAG: dipicolinate synthase subunit DpsA [Oscillospiraceae bacterium]|jgi:dipicolinate synthase subunit A|nr:dipicolinate synthase subunit DpsA [Oscillospiraceae bacterium]
MKFAVIGGDMRQVKLAELLAADGHDVATFALDKMRKIEGAAQLGTAKAAAAGAQVVVLPLPLASREGMLSATLSAGLHTVREVLSALSPQQIILAGRIDDASREAADTLGLTLTDYFEREELAVSNAVAAVEGALKIMIEETPVTLWRAKCLVVGFGRIGKLLSHRLRSLGAHVTATARSHADLAWIRAYGYDSMETGKLDGRLGEYDFVVNTVPARVISEARMRELKPDCLCLDLASKPGGMDFEAASKLAIHAVWALSLPGEVAPVTSGAIIRDTVYNILGEKGMTL